MLSALNPDRLYFDKTKLEFLLLLLVLSQVKSLTTIVLSGTHHGDVTAFFLYYSQDGQRWTVWRTKLPAPVSDSMQINTLTSVFEASVLLLMINCVITLSML